MMLHGGFMVQDYFDERYLDCIYFTNKNLCGPRKSGKTSWLRAIMNYYSKEHPILFLDFSDCMVTSYDDFIRYLARKMASLYIEIIIPKINELTNICELENCLDIVEGNPGESLLKSSLFDLIRLLDFRIGKKEDRPMIFVDDIANPVMCSVKYGFYNQVNTFFEKFLDIDHYELTGGIYTTSFAPPNVDVDYTYKYISNKAVNGVEVLFKYCNDNNIYLEPINPDIVSWRGEFHNKISLVECCDEYFRCIDLKITEPNPEVCFDEALSQIISEKRIWIKVEKERIEKAKKEFEEKEKIEYATSFKGFEQVPSDFAGVRRLPELEIDDDKVDKLNSYLRTLYDSNKYTPDWSIIYDKIQNLKREERLQFDSTEMLVRLKEIADSITNIRYCKINVDDGYWARFEAQYKECPEDCADISLVKAYLTVVRIEQLGVVFTDIVKYLLNCCHTMFYAKVSKVKRDDQICLWVNRDDFLLLEQYVCKNDDMFCTPLPFVGYRGKIGISREFYDWTSHNAVQSKLISNYFNVIDTRESINIMDMYSLYIAAWNGYLPEGHLFSREYKKSNAQELIILLETFSILIGNARIDNNHILMNGDKSLWCALGRAENWCQLDKYLAWYRTR